MRHSLNKFKSKLYRPEYLKVLILRTLGNFLLFSSLFLIIKTFYLPVKEELRFFIDSYTKKQYIVTLEATLQLEQQRQEIERSIETDRKKGLLAQVLKFPSVEFLIPENPDFSIVIPKIGANSAIIANVDAADSKIYLDALQRGVAQAAGSAYPGEDGHIFLFAHSTDYFWNVGSYNAIFYLLAKLEKTDEINLFYKGQRFVYKVIDKVIVDPDQVQYLTRKTNREFLTLQTCWPAGTTLKRLLVFATRVSE